MCFDNRRRQPLHDQSSMTLTVLMAFVLLFASIVAKTERCCTVMLQSVLDLDHNYIRALLEADLSSAKGIQECTKAASALLRCMSAEIHPCMNPCIVSEMNLSQKQKYIIIYFISSWRQHNQTPAES